MYYTVISSIPLSKDGPISPVSSLFTSVGPDILLFLADVWTSPPEQVGVDADAAAYTALRHTLAFIRARTTTMQVEDLQVVIPALLVPLQSPDRRLRETAVQCTAELAALGEKGKPKSIYSYDDVYGAASGSSFTYHLEPSSLI